MKKLFWVAKYHSYSRNTILWWPREFRVGKKYFSACLALFFARWCHKWQHCTKPPSSKYMKNLFWVTKYHSNSRNSILWWLQAFRVGKSIFVCLLVTFFRQMTSQITSLRKTTIFEMYETFILGHQVSQQLVKHHFMVNTGIYSGKKIFSAVQALFSSGDVTNDVIAQNHHLPNVWKSYPGSPSITATREPPFYGDHRHLWWAIFFLPTRHTFSPGCISAPLLRVGGILTKKYKFACGFTF